MLRTVLVTLASVSAAVPAGRESHGHRRADPTRAGDDAGCRGTGTPRPGRQDSPEGFQLDPEHAPHITLVQRFVATADNIDKLLEAVDAVKMSVDLSALQMTATGIYHIPSGKIGLAGIVIAPSPELLALQKAVIDAVQPFARTGGDASAFVPDVTGTPFDPELFSYVETFVPNSSGEKYNPHVTVGIAPLGWLEVWALEKQPFEPFPFGADGIAVYHLGNFGTASRRLDDG